MESMFMDNPPMNLRKGLAANKSTASNGFHGALPLKFLNSSPSHFYRTEDEGLFKPKTLPLYASLPSYPSMTPPTRQPPLLPLPFSKTKAIVSPGITGTAIKKRRSPNHGRKEAKPSKVGIASQSVSLNSEANIHSELMKHAKGAVSSREIVYSPPPSSLPLPRFALMKAKTTASGHTSCNVEVIVNGGAAGARKGISIGTVTHSDDLHHVLRL